MIYIKDFTVQQTLLKKEAAARRRFAHTLPPFGIEKMWL